MNQEHDLILNTSQLDLESAVLPTRKAAANGEIRA
jgi:hypothetical protein